MCCTLRIQQKKLYIPWNQNLNNLIKWQTDPESATIHALGLKSKNHSKDHCPRLSSQNTTHNSSFSNTTLQTFTVISTNFWIFLFQVLNQTQENIPDISEDYHENFSGLYGFRTQRKISDNCRFFRFPCFLCSQFCKEHHRNGKTL